MHARPRWPRPRLAIDPVVIAQPSTQQPRAQLLLVRRKNPPFKGYWSLPGGGQQSAWRCSSGITTSSAQVYITQATKPLDAGGFVNGGERLEHAVTREVLEETAVNLSSVPLTQVHCQWVAGWLGGSGVLLVKRWSAKRASCTPPADWSVARLGGAWVQPLGRLACCSGAVPASYHPCRLARLTGRGATAPLGGALASPMWRWCHPHKACRPRGAMTRRRRAGMTSWICQS